MSSEAKFNELVKKMLNFNRSEEQPEVVEKTQEDNTEPEQKQEQENSASFRKTDVLPRKDRRLQDRVAKRLQKIKDQGKLNPGG